MGAAAQCYVHLLPAMINKTCGYFVVGFVYALVASISYCFNRFVLLPDVASVAGGFAFVASNTIVALIYIAHWNCMCSDPGFVPVGWGQELKQSEAEADLEAAVEATMKSKACYCTKCRNERPDRAHHCKVCGRCVVNMDHHCPWMNNCVGLHNRKLFIVFLFYAVLGCSIVGFGMLSTFFDKINNASGADALTVIIIYLMDVALVLSIGGLLFFQLKMVYMNQTTLEVLAQGRPIYDRGWQENFQVVCGVNPWFWLLPWKLGAPKSSPILNGGQEHSSLVSGDHHSVTSP